MAEEAKTLWVKSARKDDRVVLYERDDAHPGGEALVFSQTPVEVGDTSLVQQRLHDRVLLKASAPEVKAAKKPEPPAGGSSTSPAGGSGGATS